MQSKNKHPILSWSDCTVEQYLEVQDIVAQKDITPTEFILEVGDIFLDLAEDITDRELREVKQSIAFIGKPVLCVVKNENLKPFNKLSIASFIDLDVTVTTNTFDESISKVAKLLYGYGDEVFQMPITDVYKAVQNYIQYRTDIYKKYPNLFDTGDPEEEDEDDELEEEEIVKPLGPAEIWMRTIFALTKGDITKYTHTMGLPHILVFNWVSLSESLKPRKQSGSE